MHELEHTSLAPTGLGSLEPGSVGDDRSKRRITAATGACISSRPDHHTAPLSLLQAHDGTQPPSHWRSMTRETRSHAVLPEVPALGPLEEVLPRRLVRVRDRMVRGHAAGISQTSRGGSWLLAGQLGSGGSA